VARFRLRVVSAIGTVVKCHVHTFCAFLWTAMRDVEGLTP
jgi:hypothetical protein